MASEAAESGEGETAKCTRPLAKDHETNPVKASYGVMIKNGVAVPLYPKD